MQQVYLVTGKPASGKTSLVKEVAAGLQGKAGGFYTEEIRVRGKRLGFKLVTLDGQQAVLAHIDFRTPSRVSKYGVDLKALEEVGVAALKRAAAECDVVVVDEIGKMELLSDAFKDTVMQILGSGKKVLGSIMLAPHPWADEIKILPQVKTVLISIEDYDDVLKDVREWLNG